MFLKIHREKLLWRARLLLDSKMVSGFHVSRDIVETLFFPNSLDK